MDALPDTTPRFALAATRFPARTLAIRFRPKTWVAFLLMGITATALCAPHAPSHIFGGVLHAQGPHGVYTEISFGPRHLIAQVHAPHLCVLHAHLVHGDPHSSHYAIEPPTGGRFCDELVDGEIVIRPQSSNEVVAEFRSLHMDWSGSFRRHTPGL